MENPASGEELSSSESNHGKVDDETTKIFIGEPAPPPVVSPHDKIQSLPRFMNLNQPAVMSTTQLMEVKSSNISDPPGRYMGDSRSTSSRPTIMTDDTDYEEMYEMFSTSFRGLRNRNRFVRHVFLLLGGQMCFSFIVYFLLVYERRIAQQFSNNVMVLVIVFTCLSTLIVIFMFVCLSWVRQAPNHLIALILMTFSWTLQFAALSAYFEFCEVMMFWTGSLMVTFFIIGGLAYQEKFEVVGGIVLIFLILGSTILCVVVVLLLHLMVGIGIKWTFVGVTLVLSLLTTILLLCCARQFVRDKFLNAKDYIYGTLIMYASITTIYIFKTLYTLCFTRTQDEQMTAR
ncbi:uncharacterized protein [Tenebrio molitor]|uniref:uncharacterized protein n=1 Tax=Tenebrio molitor TaxID=7067 RepID=UPI00362472CA